MVSVGMEGRECIVGAFVGSQTTLKLGLKCLRIIRTVYAPREPAHPCLSYCISNCWGSDIWLLVRTKDIFEE